MRRILERWRRGGSYLGIAAELNAEGIPTKRVGRWHAATVRKIVRRRDLVRGRSGAILERELIRVNGRISVPVADGP